MEWGGTKVGRGVAAVQPSSAAHISDCSAPSIVGTEGAPGVWSGSDGAVWFVAAHFDGRGAALQHLGSPRRKARRQRQPSGKGAAGSGAVGRGERQRARARPRGDMDVGPRGGGADDQLLACVVLQVCALRLGRMHAAPAVDRASRGEVVSGSPHTTRRGA